MGRGKYFKNFWEAAGTEDLFFVQSELKLFSVIFRAHDVIISEHSRRINTINSHGSKIKSMCLKAIPIPIGEWVAHTYKMYVNAAEILQDFLYEKTSTR